MSESSKFSFAVLGRHRKRNLGDLEGLINLLPLSVLLVDNESRTILAASPKALELTGYTSRELIGLGLVTVFPEWNDQYFSIQPVDFKSDPNRSLKLARRGLPPVTVNLISRLLNPAQRLSVLMLENDEHRQITSSTTSGELWKPVTVLLKVMQHYSQVELGLKKILEFGVEISKAEILAIYTTSQSDISFVHLVGVGDSDWLPKKVLYQDISNLNSKNIWYPGKRATSIFQRQAQTQAINYMTIAAIGEPNATIGLLVIASRGESPHPFLAQIAELIAAASADLIGNAVLSSANEDLVKRMADLDVKYQITQDHLAEGMMTISNDLSIVSMNPTLEMMLGYAKSETKKQPIANILVGAEPLLEALSSPPPGKIDVFSDTVRIYRRRGETFLARVKALSLNSDQSQGGYILLIQDLTHEEQIREQTRQLEQRAILGEITAVFAHEVRNPINNISTGLELMQFNMPPDDPNRQAVTRLLGDCDRLADLMKSVLSYAKPAEYSMTRLPLAPFLKNIIDRLLPRLERFNVICRLEIGADCPPILGNASALEQVFVNLVNNSINAMSEQGGELTIRAHKPIEQSAIPQSNAYEYVEINIIDTGPGIPVEQQGRIFTPFFTTSESGTGLGLAIAKRIITAHKGMISVTSFPGGTMVSIQLPAIVQQA